MAQETPSMSKSISVYFAVFQCLPEPPSRGKWSSDWGWGFKPFGFQTAQIHLPTQQPWWPSLRRKEFVARKMKQWGRWGPCRGCQTTWSAHPSPSNSSCISLSFWSIQEISGKLRKLHFLCSFSIPGLWTAVITMLCTSCVKDLWSQRSERGSNMDSTGTSAGIWGVDLDGHQSPLSSEAARK